MEASLIDEATDSRRAGGEGRGARGEGRGAIHANLTVCSWREKSGAGIMTAEKN